MTEFIPTDTLFGQQWYLRNTGQTGFGPGNIDLDITTVWPDYTGDGTPSGNHTNHVHLSER